MESNAVRYVTETMKNISSASDVKLVADAAARPFHDASAKGEWNSRNCFMLCALPDEVFTMCFAILPIQDRVAVAVVCRRWRRISTELSTLWTELSFPPTFFPRHEKLLPTLLSRSDAKPLHLSLDLSCEQSRDEDKPDFASSCYCDFVYECIEEHIHHLRSLQLKNVPPSYICSDKFDGVIQAPFTMRGLNAPLLETLEVTALIGLPNAPMLRCLTTSSVCRAPSSMVFLHMASLDVKPLDEYIVYLDFARRSFKMFPGLKYFRSSGSIFLPRKPIPSTLARLELGTKKLVAPYLTLYFGCSSLRYVSLTGVDNLDAGFSLFFSMRSAATELTIFDAYVQIEALGLSVRIYDPSAVRYIAQTPHYNSRLATVVRLDVQSLANILPMAGQGLSFPALNQIHAHAFSAAFENRDLDYISAAPGDHSIDVPHLRVLTIYFRCPKSDCPGNDWNMTFKEPQAYFRDLADFWNKYIVFTDLAPEALVLSGMPWDTKDLNVTPLHCISHTIRTDAGEILHSLESRDPEEDLA